MGFNRSVKVTSGVWMAIRRDNARKGKRSRMVWCLQSGGQQQRSKVSVILTAFEYALLIFVVGIKVFIKDRAFLGVKAL
jgi:hypothetical protein